MALGTVLGIGSALFGAAKGVAKVAGAADTAKSFGNVADIAGGIGGGISALSGLKKKAPGAVPLSQPLPPSTAPMTSAANNPKQQQIETLKQGIAAAGQLPDDQRKTVLKPLVAGIISAKRDELGF